jgi:tRNA-dihydrouridine synthase
MRFYYAPMEGITLYPLRNIHRQIMGDGVDKYFTPFLTATNNHHFKNREKKDVLPDKNIAFDDYGNQVVPQLMAGNAADFLWAAGEIKKLGYEEVNLNLGCPAPTVVNRHKGAGLLQDPEYLKQMLDEIFEEAAKDSFPQISLKTRLGFSDDKEADALMNIYAAYPVKELTIHARVREDYYSGNPRYEAYKRAVEVYRESGGKADICYNGNVDSVKSFEKIKDLPCDSVMIGRGLLTDPALVRCLRGGEALKPKELRDYLGALYEGYAQYIPEDRNVIFKMLEHWAFLHVHFKDCDKYLKAIRKSRSKGEYHAAVNNIFAGCEFIGSAY